MLKLDTLCSNLSCFQDVMAVLIHTSTVGTKTPSFQSLGKLLLLHLFNNGIWSFDWYCDLICIFLITSDIEHHFIYLLDTCMSFKTSPFNHLLSPPAPWHYIAQAGFEITAKPMSVLKEFPSCYILLMPGLWERQKTQPISFVCF